MKSKIKILPDSIVKAFKRLALILTISMIVYLIFQFSIFWKSKTWLESNKNITYIESNTNIIFENLMQTENILLKYIKEVPIFTLGYVKEFHPYKAEIKKITKENNKLIEGLINKIQHKESYEKFTEIKALFNELTIDVLDLLYKKNSISNMKKIYNKIEGKIYSLRNMTSGIQEDHIIERNKNINMLSKNMYYNLTFLIILALIVSFVFFLVYNFNKILNKKISYLTDQITSISNIENIIEVKYDYNDEIKPVINVFNNLVKKISKTAGELIKTKNYLNNIFNSSPDLLISIDENGIITNFNMTVFQYIQVLNKNLIGKPFWELHVFFEKYKLLYKNVIENKKQLKFKRESFEGDEKKFMDVILYPLISDSVIGVVIRVEDVTKIEKLDEQLRQSQKMDLVGNLAGGLAHDFNNVLGGIVGTVSLMKYVIKNSQKIDKEKIEKYVETLENASERAGNMVNQLLTLSRKTELILSKVDIKNSLKNIEKICKNSFSKNVKLDFKYSEEKFLVKADPTQIEQVLLNLCINAEHAMTIMRKEDEKQEGVLEVSLDKIYAEKTFCSSHQGAEERAYCIISIKDNGVGMTNKTREKIFDPFFSTKGAGKGTGLGLSMVYSILEQHNGFIEVYSEIGYGTVFHLYIPEFVGNVPGIEREKENEDIQIGEGLVLIIDDEEIIRELGKNILEKCGYSVLSAEGGKEGIAIFKEKHKEIDAVLLDFAMPVMTGKDVFVELRKISPDCKILLTSGFSQDERVKQIINMGANGFIKKPFSLIKLCKKIYSIIYE